MPPKPTPQQSRDRYAYIPPGASQAMGQQMQRGLPAHLQKYASGNSGYVPRSAEAAITAHMQKNLPGHLKQYAGAYVQQNISSYGSAQPRAASPTTRPLNPPPPLPDKLNLSHTGDVAADQYNVQFLNLFQGDGPQTVQPGQVPDQPASQTPNNGGNQNPNDPYGFIMNSPGKPQRSFRTPSGTGARIAVVAGGIILLIIIGMVVSSFLSKGSKAQTQQLLEISQRQTEIIRISTQADKKAKTTVTKQFALTTRLTTESSQKDVNELLAKKGYNEKKLSKVLSASKNAKSDTALEDAEKNNRFDETFTQIVTSELKNYQKQLNSAAGGASKAQKKILQKSFNDAAIIQKKVEKSTPVYTPSSDEEDITFDDPTLSE